MGIQLLEATATATKGNKPGQWSAVLITPGKGSSGVYSEEVLREYGPLAFKKGAKSYVTHNKMPNGERDPFSQWGFLTEDAHYEDGVGLVGVIEVLPSFRDRIEEVAPHTALSVAVQGEKDDNDNITALYEDVTNGVDLVSYAGRPGSSLVEKLYESMKTSANEAGSGTGTPAGRQTQETIGDAMDKEEYKTLLAEALDGFAEKFTATLTEALKPAAPEVDVLDEAALAEAAVKAEIPEEMRKSIYESAKGKKHSEALALVESAKTVVDSIRKSLTEAAKPATESYVAPNVATGDAKSYLIDGWK